MTQNTPHHKRREHKKSVVGKSMTLLKKAGAGERLSQHAHIDAKREPLLAACAIIGDTIDVLMQLPKGKKEQDATVEDIARASHISVRRMYLEGRWWENPTVPLLAFRKDGLRPIALLSHDSYYELHDPLTGSPERVDEAIASTLLSYTYVFYPPLPEGTVSTWQLIKYIFRQQAHRELGMMVLAAMCGGILGLVTPIALSTLFATIIPSHNVSLLAQLFIALVTTAVVTALFAIVEQLSFLRFKGKIDVALQGAVWDRVLNLPLSFFHRYTAGDLTTRAQAVDRAWAICSTSAVRIVLRSVFSVFSLALMFYYDVELAAWVLGFLTILFIFRVIWISRELRYHKRMVAHRLKLEGLLLQFFSAIGKLRVAGAEIFAFHRWAQQFSALKENSFFSGRLDNIFAVFYALIPMTVALLMYIQVLYFSDNLIDSGTFIAFSAALASLMGATISTFQLLPTFLPVVSMLSYAKPIFKTLPEVDKSKHSVTTLKGAINIDRISFRYHPGGPLVLDNVSMKINPGQFVALVGPSGSGKSTIFRILLGLTIPESGTVYFDSHEIDWLDVRSLRRQVGVVIQDGRLLPGDIMTNILGSSGLKAEDAWEAARLAGLEEDILHMPMGMHTLIGEGASLLSGGQIQRLMIARALVKKPKILLLDEATSALDNPTQSLITENLRKLDVTRIVIAHRLTTVAQADHIYVLQEGKLVESGTFKELSEASGSTFNKFVKRQSI